MELEQYNQITAAMKAAVEGFGGKLSAMQTQLDAIDKRLVPGMGIPGSERKTLRQYLKENENVSRILRDRRGSCVLNFEGDDAGLMEQKTTITSAGVGWQTTGVLQIERIPGITPEARAVLKVRNVLPSSPTSLQVVEFVKVSTPMGIASPQQEASPKVENATQFTSFAERVKTIATWIPASKQILDDFGELAGYLENALPFYVDLAEEIQLLSGDGTGENLHGLLPQSTAFNTSLLPPASSGWQRIDVIARAILQINQTNEIDPSFVILNPKDYWALRLTKDSLGRYLLGDPQESVTPNVFGLSCVWTPNMPVGTFLVGSGSPVASEIRDRMKTTVEISTEHSDYFVRNLVAIRAEKRLAYIMKRGGSFIQGTLNSSPVS
jgi:HK97 family phage major capsid protein